MTHSANALNLISTFEGLRLAAYQDQGGVWTIGYGHTGNVVSGMIITKVQAALYLNADVVTADVAINKVVKVPLSQNQFDALVSFVFNIGVGHFESSTVLKDLNNKNYQGAADALLMWNKVAGQDNAGLTRRRNAERELFLKG